VQRILLLAVLTCLGRPLAAQTGGRVGVADIRQVIVSTRDGKAEAAHLESKFAQDLKRVQGKEQALKAARQQLAAENARKHPGLPWRKAARKRLQREVDVMNKDYERDREDMRAILEVEQKRTLNVLGQRATRVAEQYARDNNFSVIGDSNSVFVVGQAAADITKDLIKAYDAFYPDLIQFK